MERFIRVDQIPESPPIQLSGTIKLNSLERLVAELGNQPATIHVELSLHNHDNNLFVSGEFSGSLKMNCDRCLEKIQWKLSEPLKLTLLPEEKVGELEEDMILGQDDLDASFYSGEQLEIFELVEEQILLMIPISKIFSESDSSNCTYCGIDLNEAVYQDASSDTISDSPFAELKNILKSE